MIELLNFPEADTPYIYFLLDDKYEVIYVGSTTQLFARLNFHQKDKIFEGVKYYECEQAEMNNLEAEEIATIQPVLNKTMPPNDLYRSIDHFKREHKLTRTQVKNICRKNSISPAFREYYDREELVRGLQNE